MVLVRVRVVVMVLVMVLVLVVVLVVLVLVLMMMMMMICDDDEKYGCCWWCLVEVMVMRIAIKISSTISYFTFKGNFPLLAVLLVLQYVVDLLFWNPFPHVSQHVPYLVGEDEPFVVAVERAERLQQFVLVQCVVVLVDHHVDEFVKVHHSIP